ncbi:peptidase M56 [Luteibacter aegosomatis]|uniref:M56 family metallopeptidase n=1 Tax=Luteibacter aegosomatis TaxID=2911537 RepID=UPI001FF7007A|nr:M56 family metallopeptidase [Luteibacter aegosomatis]UPG86748.1 peptidase M56 [Luteibacter aegosomatis]
MDAFADLLASRLVHASAQAVVLGGLVFVVCRALPSLSAGMRALLWWLVGAQLLLGIACPSLLELPLLPARHVATAGTTIVVDAGGGDMPSGMPTSASTTSVAWTVVLLALWAVAVLLQLAIAAWRARHLPGLLRRAMPHDDVRVETLCARRAHELGLRRSPRLAVSHDVVSPQVVGLWRPTILLPADDALDERELDMALMHELAHVRRGDLLLGWLPALARILFFFHPLAHLAVREYAVCREAACDALVVSRGRQAAQSYGRLLLRLGVSPHPHHALPGASPTFLTLKRRLTMLGRINETPPRVLTLALVAMAVVATALPWRVVAASDHGQEKSAGTYAAPIPPTPLAPPAPVAPATPLTPPTPPTPVTPVTPMTPPTPPVPPTPLTLATPGKGMRIVTIQGDRPARAFILYSDDLTVMRGDPDDYRRAEAARPGNDPFVWYRDGDKAWVLSDRAYLQRIREIYAKAQQPAEAGREQAERQQKLDMEQAALNEQMARLSARQAELVSREMNAGGASATEYAAGHAAIGREQADLGKKMAAIGQVRAEQGKANAALAQRQKQAADQASAEVDALLAKAVREGVAKASR